MKNYQTTDSKPQRAGSQSSSTLQQQDSPGIQRRNFSPMLVLCICTAVSLTALFIAQNFMPPSKISALMSGDNIIQETVKILPPADQQWRHATTSVAMLTDALQNSTITAIETDLLMGYDTTVDPLHEKPKIPITSHPPEIESDLSVAKLFDMLTSTSNSDKKHRVLRKHIKLDFKELEVVEPSLELFTNVSVNPNGKMVYLNADILPGPGNRKDANIEANAFLSTCLGVIDTSDQRHKADHEKLHFAFSLGYKCDYHFESGFTNEDLEEMSALVKKYNVMERSAGVVLAINARLLAKDMAPFDTFLQEYPTAQILAWTGHGEPPIPRDTVDEIKKHFNARKTGSRVGFDCQISE